MRYRFHMKRGPIAALLVLVVAIVVVVALSSRGHSMGGLLSSRAAVADAVCAALDGDLALSWQPTPARVASTP